MAGGGSINAWHESHNESLHLSLEGSLHESHHESQHESQHETQHDSQHESQYESLYESLHESLQGSISLHCRKLGIKSTENSWTLACMDILTKKHIYEYQIFYFKALQCQPLHTELL